MKIPKSLTGTLFCLASCATTDQNIWGEKVYDLQELMKEKEAIINDPDFIRIKKSFNYEEALKEVPFDDMIVFEAIASAYVKDIHDCDDMAQRYRDYQRRKGISEEDVRIVAAQVRKPEEISGHMWFEKRVKNQDYTEWRVYDLAQKRMNYPSVLMHEDFKVLRYLYGDRVYIDKSGGYTKKGDEWDSKTKTWSNASEEKR